ncbi:MAG: CHAT domain-containing protein, partial [Chloroflexota bacterium]
MPLTLRLSQFAEAEADTFRVEWSLDHSAPVRTRFTFTLSDQDREDLRWYLEDYLQYPLDPAPTIAARIEQRMKDIGVELFHHVFESSATAQRGWARLQPQLQDTRIEIITDVKEATTIPWELLRDPVTDEALLLRARAFVRAPSDQAQPPTLTPSPSQGEGSKVRILLVICRPNAGADVPFRSVATRIIKGLTDEARAQFQLDVLRPPTFAQLSKTLRAAKASGKPYHVVHFDGHGTYAELIPPQRDESDNDYAELLKQILKQLNALTLGTPRTGKHGYLLFENPQTDENMQLIDGPTLGKLLVENDVPTLVLNACQSAFADVPTAPLVADEAKVSEVGAQVRAFGSLALEVMDAGVAGVVAMRYSLYVETAKQFVADLYAALARGQSLGEAVTFGRKQLAAQPEREIAYQPIALQDWSVPIVYEASEIRLFPPTGAHIGAPLHITLDKEMAQRGTEVGLPPRPDVGFFGRDETLLALDRAFDPSPSSGQAQSVVLLHAFAGSGKTTTAAEFARWYALTGGIAGPILFTSFEQYKPLPRVLDTLGQVFGGVLEQAGIQWLALDDAARRNVALQVLRQVPVLWIWDNVEPIA